MILHKYLSLTLIYTSVIDLLSLLDIIPDSSQGFLRDRGALKEILEVVHLTSLPDSEHPEKQKDLKKRRLKKKKRLSNNRITVQCKD